MAGEATPLNYVPILFFIHYRDRVRRGVPVGRLGGAAEPSVSREAGAL